MARYDFKSLSHQDFEELMRDLLQAEWGVALEAFKTGRDQGVDLRYARIESAATIIQCKHYAASTFSKLLSHLRNDELPKVKRLQPRRYVVAASLGLSVGEKDKIVAALSPFVLIPYDVLGVDDINGLLSRHSSVERANFKLWLTNTEVIARIVHNAEACQTQFEVDRIRKKLPVFVQSGAYCRARQLLEEQRVVIVSGVPGIGKTTLAEMLLFAHLDDGYEPVVIQTDIAEGKRLYRSDRKQIFYYDDFLGQTFLGDQRSYIGRNHDAALLSFMEMVRATSQSRFILTTREHILRQAMQASERFQHSAAQNYKCVLELGDYSFGQRARILYNHLYFSQLPSAYKEAVLKDDFFLEIIKHEHFNPRLVEWLTTLTRLSSPSPDMYCESISTLLQSPERIWSHAFQTQISDAARNLLLTLYSLGDWVDVEQLSNAFDTVHRGSCQRYNRPRAACDFRAALQELDGSFLTYSSGRAIFLNPSIRDFTARVICRDPSVALGLVTDATRFKQLSNISKIAWEPGGESLRSVLNANQDVFRANVERLMTAESILWETVPGGRVGHSVDTGEELRLEEMVEWCEQLQSPVFVDMARTYTDLLLKHWNTQTVEFWAANLVLKTMKKSRWFMKNGGEAISRSILSGLLAHVSEARANDWGFLLELPELAVDWTQADEDLLSVGLDDYRRTGIDDERDNCNDVSDLNNLKDSLKKLEDKYSLGFARAIAAIDRQIEENEERDHEDEGTGGGFSRRAGPLQGELMTDEEVRDMFRTLRG